MINKISAIPVLLFVIFGVGCASIPSENDEAQTNPEITAASVKKYLDEGDSAARSGDLDEAMLKYLLALEADKANVLALYKVSTVHRLKNNYSAARAGYSEAIAIDANHFPSREGLALIELKSEKLAIAQAMFTSILEAEPDRVESLNAMGLINDLTEKYEKAQEYYARALSLNPRSSRIKNNLGYSYYLQGDLDAAERTFSSLTKADSSYQLAWSNLALIHAKRGDFEQAKKAFDQIGKPHQTLNNLGYLQLLMGENGIARETLKEAADVAPRYYAIAKQNLESLNGRDNGRVERDRDSIAGGNIESPVALASPGLGVTSIPKSKEITIVSSAPTVRIVESADIEAPKLALNDVSTNPKLSRSTTRNKLLTRETVLSVQTNLKNLGFDPGKIDGVLGNATIAAIRNFQRSNDLPVTGAIDDTLLFRLN